MTENIQKIIKNTLRDIAVELKDEFVVIADAKILILKQITTLVGGVAVSLAEENHRFRVLRNGSRAK